MAQRARFVLSCFVMLAFATAACMAPEAQAGPKYPRIAVTPGKPAAKDLAAFIDQLRKAVKSGNESLILSRVANDFLCLRDFGDSCEDGMSAAAKFKSSLGFGVGNGAARFGYLEELLQAERFAKTTASGSVKVPLLCAPAVPAFDEAKAEAVNQRHFKGEEGEFWLEWIAIEASDVPAFSKPEVKAQRLAMLSRELVHLGSPPGDMAEGWIAVDLPSGQSGFIEAKRASWLLLVQLCYSKDAKRGWQIAAHVGGGD